MDSAGASAAAMAGQSNNTNTVSGSRAASWKIRTNAAELPTQRIPLHQARQFFAVDASGSTAGSIIRYEHGFVEKLKQGHGHDMAVTWGTSCGNPTTNFDSITWQGNMGGTEPSTILEKPGALETLAGADVWYLLTDGEIWEQDVQKLCRLALDRGVLNVPVIFVITGYKQSTPADVNVSVGISFFANAPDVLVLFKEMPTGHISLIAGKGCFAPLFVGDGADANANSAPDLSSWTRLKKLFSEGEFIRLCRDTNIQIPAAASRPKHMAGIVSLGEEWQQANDGAAVDVDLLFTGGGKLSHEDLEQLLADEAFNNLAVACKTRGRIQDLRAFLLTQKIEELNVKLEDVSGASAIVARLGDPALDTETRATLQQQLREAHAANRRHYQDALKNINESPQEQALRARKRAIDHALEQLAELESSAYTADILSRRSNRARRAANVNDSAAIPITTLDLDAPTAFRGECRICCGESEVMSIALKAGADGAANTDNFALDFPLAVGRWPHNHDLISSQFVCFQCALAQDEGTRSIFREELAAVVPTLDYDGSNKKYIQEQLYVALTGGLQTGASGLSQLFMTILDRTLKDKEWAGAGVDHPTDPEVTARRDLFEWVLSNMLQRTGCRETFSEVGPWTTFPEALKWAAKDFRAEGVDSWAVGYPVAGFTQLVRFGTMAGAFDEALVRDMRAAKLLHSVASAHMAGVLKHPSRADDAWKQPLLELIYARFNADMVPMDVRSVNEESGRSAALVTSPQDFWARLSAYLGADAELLAGWAEEDKAAAMPPVQLLAFWLAYFVLAHMRAKSVFQTLRTQQPLAHTVLGVNWTRSNAGAPDTLAPSVVDPVLLSIFRAHGGNSTKSADQAFHAKHTGLAPFASPFGLSVLRCGFPACAHPFVAASQLPHDRECTWTLKQLDALRAARATHLGRAFGVDERFAAGTQTGMPEPTATPTPPASTHVNLHVSVARCWARLEQAERKRIVQGAEVAAKGGVVEAVDRFAGAVRREICEGRRGDVFQDSLEDKVRAVLPSFVDALRVALRVEGREGEGVEAFEHDWEQKKLDAKARYEMRLARAVEKGEV